ncbi:MAG: RNA-binding cell elongation regulator Jag/EloR [Thermomicrobiales bacterium]|jgi:spoIIIJ-associated protein|nr:RNA-binding cell elongation regulator Jag/EloR [Thermomicrobiales bacterium]
MMDRRRKDSVEIQAISVDEAVRLALEQLGRTRDEVDIEVLAEPSDTGDLEAEEALVRVTVRGYASQPAPLARAGGRQRPSGGGAAVATTIREPDENDTVAIAVTSELLGVMGFQAQVVPAPTGDSFDDEADAPPTIALNIVGDDLGMLIGRRGEHLAQLQYLVNLLVNRRLGHWIRIALDVEGYKRRREESLIGLADRVARQVARSGRPIPLEPMPANERRVIHLALRNDPEVMTESNGEGDLRRVVIQPKA